MALRWEKIQVGGPPILQSTKNTMALLSSYSVLHATSAPFCSPSPRLHLSHPPLPPPIDARFPAPLPLTRAAHTLYSSPNPAKVLARPMPPAPSQKDALAELLSEAPRGGALLPSRRGRPSGSAGDLELVRPLVAEDIPLLGTPNEASPPAIPTVIALRASHHELARLLAQDEPLEVISAMTGYSPSWISNLRRDPSMDRLIEHYRVQKDLVYVDLLERQKLLGVMVVQELTARVAEKAQDMSSRELGEIFKEVVKPGTSPQGGAPAPPLAPPVAIQINFVPGQGRALSPSSSSTIEGEVLRP